VDFSNRTFDRARAVEDGRGLDRTGLGEGEWEFTAAARTTAAH